jgi:uncharacterized membrane protein
VSDSAEPGATADQEGAETARDLDRVVFFSDAVFAIAMTVLVLTLQLPARTTDAEVAHALRAALPSVYTYALSFAVISLYWLAHHRMFRYVRELDPILLILNLAMLGFVAFVPFPTSVMGDHGGTTAAVVFYASTMAVLGSLISGLWLYASRQHLIAPDTPRAFIRHSLWRGLTLPIVFAASIPIAFANPHAAEYFWLTIVIWRVLLRRHYGRLGPQTRRSSAHA